MTNLQLTAKDHAFLEYLLHAAKDVPLYHQLLERKLDMAVIVPAESLDPDTATIGSTIVFKVGGGSSEERVLTRHEHMAGITAAVPLPVTTARGLALLGLRAGDLFALRTRGGVVEPLQLESVRLPNAGASRRLRSDASLVAFPSPVEAISRGSWPADEDDDPGPRAA
jgi:regulator of nucleoside diphosphate kinase